MKILAVNKASNNAYIGIKASMKTSKKFETCNGLDACGCTGNDLC